MSKSVEARKSFAELLRSGAVKKELDLTTGTRNAILNSKTNLSYTKEMYERAQEVERAVEIIGSLWMRSTDGSAIFQQTRSQQYIVHFNLFAQQYANAVSSFGIHVSDRSMFGLMDVYRSLQARKRASTGSSSILEAEFSSPNGVYVMKLIRAVIATAVLCTDVIPDEFDL